MAIKNIGDFQQVLKSYDAKGWSRDVELGKGMSFDDFPHLNEIDGKKQASFGDFLADSLAKVNSLQNEANVAMEKLASGETKNIHETLLTVERADMAFRMMNQVRSKVVDAYKEIMKMQV